MNNLERAAELMLEAVNCLHSAGEDETAELLEKYVLASFGCEKCHCCEQAFTDDELNFCTLCRQHFCDNCKLCACDIDNVVRNLLS